MKTSTGFQLNNSGLQLRGLQDTQTLFMKMFLGKLQENGKKAKQKETKGN